METIRKNILKWTGMATIIILLIYIGLYTSTSNDIQKLKDNAINTAITSLSFVSSILMLIIVIFEKDEWFKELKDYRTNLQIGSIVATIYSGIDIYMKFYDLFKEIS